MATYSRSKQRKINYGKEHEVQSINTKQIFDGIYLTENIEIDVDADGVEWVRRKDVDSILSENEFMKEELYQRQADEINRVYQYYAHHVGQSTSQITKQIRAQASRWGISEIAMFNMVYSILYRIIPEKIIPDSKQQSKIRKAWQMGLLPIVGMIIHCIAIVDSQFNSVAFKEMNPVYKKLAEEYKPKKSHKKKTT